MIITYYIVVVSKISTVCTCLSVLRVEHNIFGRILEDSYLRVTCPLTKWLSYFLLLSVPFKIPSPHPKQKEKMNLNVIWEISYLWFASYLPCHCPISSDLWQCTLILHTHYAILPMYDNVLGHGMTLVPLLNVLIPFFGLNPPFFRFLKFLLIIKVSYSTKTN